ncbi:MAG: hypothetical protein H5T96_03100 [Tissierellales bacterium]|nr:hypothetical protein [Tissierellales bacterium]
MKKYIRDYEKWIIKALRGDEYSYEDLLYVHQLHIDYFRHERLIHLLVTIFTSILMLTSLYFSLKTGEIIIFILFGILFITTIFYFLHYFFLENTLLRMYKLTDKILGIKF